MSPTWETTSDWDGSQSETGTHHEQPTDTDWAASDKVEKGYPSSDEGGTSLEAYWPLDDDSTPINDVSGNNHDSTSVVGTAIVSGILNTDARDFDGSDDEMQFGDIIIDGLSAFTVVVWINADAIPSDSPAHGQSGSPITGKSGSSDDNFALYLGNSDEAYLYIDDGSNHSITTTSSPISTNTWHMVAGVYDGSGLELFVDGTSEASSSFSGGSVINNSNDLSIGRDGTNDFFNGTVDEARIYSRALSSSEITDLYNAAL